MREVVLDSYHSPNSYQLLFMHAFKNFYVFQHQFTPRILHSFPNLRTYPQLQHLTISLKTNGLLSEIQNSLYELEDTIRSNQHDFLGHVGFYLNPSEEQFVILREAPTLKLSQLNNSHLECPKSAQEILKQAEILVLRHHEWLQTLLPQCLDIYLTSTFEVRLSFAQDRVVFSRNDTLDPSQYVDLFRKQQLKKLKSQPPQTELKPAEMSQQVLYYAMEQFSYLQLHSLANLVRQHLYCSNRIYNKVVEEKYRLKNRNFDWHWLSTDDANTGQPIKGKMYNNPLCGHFDSFSQESIRQTYDKCKKCGQMIVVDLTKIFLYQNRFLKLLSRNFLSGDCRKILYSFKTGAFFYDRMYNFFNYSHMQEYMQSARNILDRPSIDLMLEEQKIFLNANSLEEMFKVSKMDVVNTPVRGMYCKHIGFYDLSSIYTQFLRKQSKMDNTFECPVCNEDVKFNELIYLSQIVSIIGLLVKSNTINQQSRFIYLLVNHRHQSVNVVVKEGGKVEQSKLDVYKSLMDPRRRVVDMEEQKEIDLRMIEKYTDLSVKPDE